VAGESVPPTQSVQTHPRLLETNFVSTLIKGLNRCRDRHDRLIAAKDRLTRSIEGWGDCLGFAERVFAAGH